MYSAPRVWTTLCSPACHTSQLAQSAQRAIRCSLFAAWRNLDGLTQPVGRASGVLSKVVDCSSTDKVGTQQKP